MVALSVNDVIGSGVYLLPAAAAALLGPASVWAVLAAGLCVLLVVLCFAEAGSMFDEPGGAYLYTREAFGDFVGFEVGWMTWVAKVTVAASLSAGFAQALVVVWPAAAAGWGRAAAISIPLLALTAINLVGVVHGARTAVFLVAGKVVPLVLLVGTGLFAMDWGRVVPSGLPSTDRLGEATLLLVFAYAGFENTGAAASEYRRPRRDVPFALLVMIAGVTAIYTLVQLVALGVVPDLAASHSPLAAAADILAGTTGVLVVTIGAVLSILGTNNNTILYGARYLYALAETGNVPRVFARVHPRFRTPWVALLVQTAIALPLALVGSFAGLASVSVIARMATYLGTAAAVPILRRKRPATERSLRLPLGPTIPLAALAVCVVFLTAATVDDLVAGAIALAVGGVLFVCGRLRAWSESRSRSSP